MVEEIVHLLRGEDGRDALWELGGGDQARRRFAQPPFPHAVLEKGTNGGELARDGAFFESLLMQMRDKFADESVRDGRERWRYGARRREIGQKLFQVLAVVEDSVRRGIPH